MGEDVGGVGVCSVSVGVDIVVEVRQIEIWNKEGRGDEERRIEENRGEAKREERGQDRV